MKAEKELLIAAEKAVSIYGKYNWYKGRSGYQIFVREKRIVATLYGGIYNSRPDDSVCPKKWEEAVKEYVTMIFGEITCLTAHVRNGLFFLNVQVPAEVLPTKTYEEPSIFGGTNLHIEVLK